MHKISITVATVLSILSASILTGVIYCAPDVNTQTYGEQTAYGILSLMAVAALFSFVGGLGALWVLLYEKK